jgi:hypothetical protein
MSTRGLMITTLLTWPAGLLLVAASMEVDAIGPAPS